jgi:hypothetical protein
MGTDFAPQEYQTWIKDVGSLISRVPFMLVSDPIHCHPKWISVCSSLFFFVDGKNGSDRSEPLHHSSAK